MDGRLGSPPTPGPGSGLVLDANVLIDYCQCDLTVLSLASKRVGKVHVPSPVLDEVHELDEDECVRLGLAVVEPELDEGLIAAQRRCGLSFQDSPLPDPGEEAWLDLCYQRWETAQGVRK